MPILLCRMAPKGKHAAKPKARAPKKPASKAMTLVGEHGAARNYISSMLLPETSTQTAGTHNGRPTVQLPRFWVQNSGLGGFVVPRK